MPSDKIKAKDLSYDSSLPPFLQRLHARNTERGDRHERPTARPKRAKDPDDDDGPTVVDTSGEIVSKEDFEKLTKADGEAEDATNKTDGNQELLANGGDVKSDHNSGNETKRGESKVTDGVAMKKRKVAKIIGDKDEGAGSELAKDNAPDQPAAKKVVKKTKKTAKPIKLAFDDDEKEG